MTYEEALAFIKTSYDVEFNLQLDRITRLIDILGNPQDDLKIIHVAGTNGKGSVCAMTAEILKTAGYKVGMFTSPVIADYREQFQVNGKMIEEHEFINLAGQIYSACKAMLPSRQLSGQQLPNQQPIQTSDDIDPANRPSEFEKSVALAFLYFKQQNCDFVILEVGMGGNFDATNVISKSEVSVIVNIDYDHMHFLGDTLEEIADKKAGIIKQDGCVVAADQCDSVLNVIRAHASRKNAKYVQTDRSAILGTTAANGINKPFQTFCYKNYQNMKLSLLGMHQQENATIVLEVIDCLKEKGFKIAEDIVYEGLANTRWPGRFEVVQVNQSAQSALSVQAAQASQAKRTNQANQINQTIIIDGAHNPNGIEALYDNLTTYFPKEKFVFVTGILRDKDYSSMLQKMIPLAYAFVTIAPNNPRAMTAAECAQAIRSAGFEGTILEGTPATAFEVAETIQGEHTICAFGSLYSVGCLRKSLNL